jgi:hypothetical protein
MKAIGINVNSEVLERLFVYGCLKPSELGFDLIKKMVDINYEPAFIQDSLLKVRDGFPFIELGKPNHAHNSTSGYLLNVLPNERQRFWKVVDAFEGNTYKRVSCEVNSESSGSVKAQVFVGKNPMSGTSYELEGKEWSYKTSPFIQGRFRYTSDLIKSDIEVLKKQLPDFPPENLDSSSYWIPIIRLEGSFLVLVSTLEYLLTMKYGNLNSESKELSVNSKLDLLGEKDPIVQEIISQSDLDSYIAPNDVRVSKQERAEITTRSAYLKKLYQTRNNLSHRGKGYARDVKFTLDAAQRMVDFLESYFSMSGVEKPL